ncbi:MAG: hypothetical protein GT600_01775, partial [Bacteroidales bacterium]|nr:hypothetical protein [Bacteroidales bacterium]
SCLARAKNERDFILLYKCKGRHGTVVFIGCVEKGPIKISKDNDIICHVVITPW